MFQIHLDTLMLLNLVLCMYLNSGLKMTCCYKNKILASETADFLVICATTTVHMHNRDKLGKIRSENSVITFPHFQESNPYKI